MSIAFYLKNNLKNIPPNIGLLLNRVPFNIRPGIGSIYRKRQGEINNLDNFSTEKKQNFIFQKIKNLTEYSYSNISFYKEHYDKHGFKPKGLQTFEDIVKIPIVNKAILNSYSLENRSSDRRGRQMVNTGGSSGTPFGFYIEANSIGHEWAHMHHIWQKLGYKSTDFKIGFGGRSDLKNKTVAYDVVRNTFSIDIYADYKLVSAKLKVILKKYNIKYLHGYPSSIYDFAVYCLNEDPELQNLLSRNLVGAFLGSEYPHSHYREVIEDVFNIETTAWYGHTERSVLAYEKNEKYVFEPFISYGFSEAIPSVEKSDHLLIATSYYNFASPLIRYNTEDLISNINEKNGILNSFTIKKGRSGEYIVDRTNKKINLTGLIFGRHHKLFNLSKFIQVKQITNGVIEIHFVSNTLSSDKAAELFDQTNLNLDIKFIKRNSPHRTKAGKINLLIK